jgi:hypothetical protein
MAQSYGNSDSTATNLAVDNFFKVVDSALRDANYGVVTWLMQNAFSPDNAGNGTPQVGISGHGPNFIGATEVAALFDKFFFSFPDFRIAQGMLAQGGPTLTGRLYARDADAPPTIGLRVTLMGTYSQPWFKKKKGIKDKKSHYSKPLSDIPADSSQVTTLEGFAVFSFANNLISQLSIYLDRYKLSTDLLPPSDTLTAQWVRQIEEEEGSKSKK